MTPPSPGSRVYRFIAALVAVASAVAFAATHDGVYAIVTVAAAVSLIAMSPTAPGGER